MNYTTLYTKLDTVPPAIKVWLGSDEVIDVIEKIPQQFNLPEYSSGVVSKLIQRLQIKDIAPEYFSGELSLELTLDKNKTLLIVDELKKNVFAPIRDDLSSYGIDLQQLEKFNPAVPPAKSSDVAPKMMSSIAPVTIPAAPQAPVAPKPVTAQAPSPAPMPKPMTPTPPASTQTPGASASKVVAGISSVTGAAASINFTKIPSAAEGKFAPFTPAPAPSSLPPTGWSKMTTPMEPPKFGPGTPGTTPATSNPSQQKPAVASAGAAPVMLHEDATFKSTDKATDFHLAKPGQGAEVPLGGVKPGQSTRPAVLELGTLGSVTTPKPQAPTAPKLTHYTEFKSDAPRNITEITSSSSVQTPAATKPAAMATPAVSMPAQKPPVTMPDTLLQKPPAIMPTIPVKPMGSPAAPATSSTAAPKVSPSMPIPQPPKPPTPTSNMPPVPPQGKVIKQDYT